MTPLQHLLERRRALERQQADVAAQLEAAGDAQRGEVIRNILTLMDDHGLTLDDVLGPVAQPPRRRGRTGIKVAPKYRDPATGATWTGRGLQPRWMRAAVAAGKSPDDFRIGR